jgi:hypothetical protein
VSEYDSVKEFWKLAAAAGARAKLNVAVPPGLIVMVFAPETLTVKSGTT